MFLFLFFVCVTEFVSSADVNLETIELFKTHKWLTSKPTVYFRCKGENKTVLSDVKKTNTLFTFKGEESFQPLTEFSNKKCKRCGFYEEDMIKSDDVFDEWELCPSDFTDPNGKYSRSVETEFNATFSCQDCVPIGADLDHTSAWHNGGKGMHWAVILLITVLVLAVFIIGVIGVYKFGRRGRERKNKRGS